MPASAWRSRAATRAAPPVTGAAELPPVDVVVATRPGADAATNAQVFRALERAWRRIRSGDGGG